MHFYENHLRSIAKAITYRALILLADGLVIFLITRSYEATILVVILSNVYSTALYFIHERIWNGIKWGKRA